MSTFDTALAIRVIIILGAINLVTALLIFFTCRCLPGWRIGKLLMKYKTYQRFYKYHCYIWMIFWTSVVAHSILAFIFVGLAA